MTALAAVNLGEGEPCQPTQPPPDIPATVVIVPPSGRVVSGTPVSFVVAANEGTTWEWSFSACEWMPRPMVHYSETIVLLDGVDVIRDHRGGGGIYQLTFQTPGDHVLGAIGKSDGGDIVADNVTVHVSAGGPPAFTVTSPANGEVVPLGEGGGHTTVALTTTSDYLPLHVTITWDGHSITDDVTQSSYSRAIDDLRPVPLGERPIAVTLADRDGLASTQTRTIIGIDVGEPHPDVDFPQPGANLVGDPHGVKTFTMRGTVSDSQSGMVGGSASVAWALSRTGARNPAQALSGNNFGDWTAEVTLTGFGAHKIHVWATDSAGNTNAEPHEVPVTVISSFTPQTLEERLNEREYLAALLSFVQEQVELPTDPPTAVDTAALVAVLRQPVDRLSQPLSAEVDQGNREINQLRVPIELLRLHLGAGDFAAEAPYRTTAYNSLLSAIGTSYAELRLARGATPEFRRTLASRLGIQLSANRPDELDQLVLDGPSLTEAALESLFGLADTTVADTLRLPGTPLLLTWQLAGLASLWADQDQHPNPPRAYSAIADPDVVSASDVVTEAKGDLVRALLSQRATTLLAYAAMLDGLRTGQDPAHALLAMQSQALPGVDLADLEAKDNQGLDIAPALAAAGLTRVGFRYLRQLSRLAATGTVTNAEWADAIAILTGAHKLTLFPAWRAQESAFVLSPDYFQTGGTAPVVNPYRVSARARVDWLATLRSRILQRQDLHEANANAVAAAEQVALPVLRETLLGPGEAGIGVGEELSARFLVDMLSGGALRTTRIRQAIESVQSLLSARRSGELPPDHPAAAWLLPDFDAFTAAWLWMGELASWRAATMAFLFPERHLDPMLLAPGTGGPLDVLLNDIRSGPFSATDALREAKKYVHDSPLGTEFTYLDPARTEKHQRDLLKLGENKPFGLVREVFWAVPMILAQKLQSSGDFAAALDWFWIIYNYDLGPGGVRQPVSIFDTINNESLSRPDLHFPPHWTTLLDPFGLVTDRPCPYTRYTLLSIVKCHLDYADAEFARETDESIAHARTLYVAARRLLAHPKLQPQQPLNEGEPALPIPELDTLRQRAQVQLAKLRQGRNIAGLPRTQPVTGAVTVRQPTPYRFKTLLERAKQLTAQAVQMEAGYLAALEKYDDRSLRVFDAMKGIDLSIAQVALAGSRVKEAGDAVVAARAQQDKAQAVADNYAEAIDAGPNKYENDLLHEYDTMRTIKDSISVADTTIGVLQAAATGANGFITSLGFSGHFAASIAIAQGVKGGLEIWRNHVEAQMQANQLQAGIEQRKTEWRLQKASAEQEEKVAAAQVTTARDQVDIALLEQNIALLQRDQAIATLKFLNDQFTNADLYLWMSNTLGGVYRYFLQQATATSRLAQAQLAFERAETERTLIRNDYWQSPAELTATAGAPNRRGLTGAERLTEDLTRLDQYAFASERRRLNLSQTFSLARLMPVEFLEFRRTGVLPFATPMSLFDNEFPGHYLRMIRQVRVSLAALLPPERGISATLRTNGISRVTSVQDGLFQDVLVRHDPSLVALTSPVSASGVFELDTQSEMLLPFESSGVDTMWELQLPPAANPFDFSTIVDVMVTVDYTALYDDDLRGQVVTRLNADRQRGGDRVFSLARDFPDQWYDLNNPADPMSREALLPLRDIDFPVSISELATSQVAVRLLSQAQVPDTVVSLRRGATGGEATTTNGIAGTRRGNAAAWIPLTGSTPAGDWRLGFGADARQLFASGELEDVILVVGWTGQAPAWTA